MAKIFRPGVEVWLAGRPSLPALVNPEPLVWERPHVAFDGGGEARGVDLDVANVVARADEFDDGAAAEDELPAPLVPGRADGDHGGVGAQGEGGDAGGRAGEAAEEGDEDALALLRVEVGEDAERAALFEQAQGRARGHFFINRPVAEARPQALDKRVDERVVNRAHEEADRLVEGGVCEAEEFPSAEVRGEEDDAAAALAREV